MNALYFLIFFCFTNVQSLSYDLLNNDKYIQSKQTSESGFRVLLITNGSYVLSINNKTWLQSSPKTFLQANGFTYSTIDKTLYLNQTSANSGSDKLGRYQTFNLRYGLYNDPNTQVEYIIYTYDDYDMVRFSQHFPNGARRTSIPNNYESVLSAFPSFNIQTVPGENVGYLSFGGMMAGDMEKLYGKWDSLTSSINDGITGGPIVLFDTNGDTLIISQMSEFMSTSVQHEKRAGGILNFGVMSGVDYIPDNYVADFVVFYSDKGINKAMEDWGKMLIKYHGKSFKAKETDVTANYLSYWMDNGAYYYWLTEKGKNYQDTLVDIYDDFTKNKIPFKSIQYDSWWYGAQRGYRQGCFEWNGNKKSDRFPQTLEFVYQKTGLPVTAHNKFWDIQTVYAKEFGGSYNFVLDPFTRKSLPDDDQFWDDLFKNGTKWGLKTYEQDWLNHQTLDFTPLMTDISLGKRWLAQMGNAASKYNLTLQYCMSLSRHVLQSLQVEAATQIRVTNDYATNWEYGGEQWRLGVSSIFSAAVGLMPFKDVYWTTANQPDNPYGPKVVNPNTELDSVVSILTAGPVGPGDKMGEYMNRTLIMKSCNDGGLLLKPSRPVTALDVQIYAKALGASFGPYGEVWSTFSQVNNYIHGIIFAADVKNDYKLEPKDMGFEIMEKSYFWTDRNPTKISPLDAITLTKDCTINKFCLFYVSASLNLNGNEIVILGEQSKWIPVSPQRVSNIQLNSNSLNIDLVGVPNESVEFSLSINSSFKKVKCNFDSTRSKMTIQINDKLGVNCS